MWRRAAECLFVLFAANAIAQDSAPQGFQRGDLIRWQGGPDQGRLTFLVWPDHVYTCSYDDKTYVERDKQRITMDLLAKGDHLEVVADRQPGSSQCYAHAIQVTPAFLPGASLRASPRQMDPPVTAGWSLPYTLTGAVSAVTPEMLILRLRSGTHKIIHLRPDTSYLLDGQATDRSALQANRVVFIRARKDLRGDPQAVQVIWGDILQPQPER
jgi:hypothetical protein